MTEAILEDNQTEPVPDTAEYARVELMGHRARVGRIQEVTRFGVTLLQVNFWDAKTGKEVSELYSGSAIYCVSPCDKSVVDAYVAEEAAYRAAIRPRYLPPPAESIVNVPTERQAAVDREEAEMCRERDDDNPDAHDREYETDCDPDRDF